MMDFLFWSDSLACKLIVEMNAFSKGGVDDSATQSPLSRICCANNENISWDLPLNNENTVTFLMAWVLIWKIVLGKERNTSHSPRRSRMKYAMPIDSEPHLTITHSGATKNGFHFQEIFKSFSQTPKVRPHG
jgi:hypothetical protein